MWCDFEWDGERLPDPRRLLAELHREGFHNCLWINPYVSCQSALYQEGATRGYFLRRPDGSVYDAARLEPAHGAGHGALRHRRLHEPRGGALVPRQARPRSSRSAPIRSSRTSPRRSRRTPASPTDSPAPRCTTRIRSCSSASPSRPRGARGPRAVAWSRSAAPGVQRYPGHWAGDSGVHVHRPGQHARAAAWPRDERARLLEPRHGRLLGRSVARALRPLGAARLPLGAEPVPRGDAARAVALRRGGARDLPRVRAAPQPAGAVPGEPRLAGVRDRHAPHAPDGHGVPRRPGRLCVRSPVLPGPGAARLAGGHAPTAGSPRTCRPGAGWTGGAAPSTRVRRRSGARCRSRSCRSTSGRTVCSSSGPSGATWARDRPIPLTVEAFVTTEATFAFRTDAGRIDFRCRRDQGRITLEARGVEGALILRLRDVDAPRTAPATGRRSRVSASTSSPGPIAAGPSTAGRPSSRPGRASYGSSDGRPRAPGTAGRASRANQVQPPSTT